MENCLEHFNVHCDLQDIRQEIRQRILITPLFPKLLVMLAQSSPFWGGSKSSVGFTVVTAAILTTLGPENILILDLLFRLLTSFFGLLLTEPSF